jgi:hypothetical protein
MNLHTIELQLRIPGLKPVNQADLAEYERIMKEEGIPQILKEMSRRRHLAEEARHRVL